MIEKRSSKSVFQLKNIYYMNVNSFINDFIPISSQFVFKFKDRKSETDLIIDKNLRQGAFLICHQKEEEVFLLFI